MRAVIVSVAVLFCVTTQYALSALELPANDCAFAGTFTQDKILDGLPTPISSSGEFYFHCEQGVIWSTTEPVRETLVLASTGKSYIVNDAETRKLTSRQGRFLGNLLNGLMGGKLEEIKSQFDIAPIESATNTYQLVPKKRALKRGITSLTISVPENALVGTDPVTPSNTFESNQVSIDILDRNQQRTIITSSASIVFDQTTSPAEQCKLVPGLKPGYCQLLLGDTP